MKILLFGGSGQVGHEIRSRARDLNFELIAPVASEVNITDGEQVLFLSKRIAPAVIINCAAYTAVDKAEAEREEAFRVNSEGAGSVALAAHEVGARLIHISTDYVFGRGFSKPITEEDQPDPLNVYGASKLAGEKAINKVLEGQDLIIRTSSVHGRWGNNIVHTILDLLQQRDELQFVSDQIMSPTWAGWLAEVILDLVRIDAVGILNASCSGEVSWYQFASQVLENARYKLPGGVNKVIRAVPSSDFVRPAVRSPYSVLSTKKLEKFLGRPALAWQEGLKKHMHELGYEQ